jgi:translation initiation factor 3 subunit B
VDLDSVVLPPGEDCGIKSDDEEEEEEVLETDTGFGNVIVVDNLPIVAIEKFDKLEGVIRKIFGQIGVICEDGLWMPKDENGKTKGYAFIEYNTPQVMKHNQWPRPSCLNLPIKSCCQS